MSEEFKPLTGKWLYGSWRTDKPREPGFSPELISADFHKIAKGTNMEDVEYYHEGCDTLYKAFQRNVERIPNSQMLGTRTGMEYNWLTFKQVSEEARAFAAGTQELNLCPEVEGDGRQWRFLGIQAKNRKEWGISHIGNFHSGTTTIALYDTLGEEAAKYVVNQTELTTVALQGNLAAKMIKMKQDEIDSGEENKRMDRLANLIIFDEVDAEVKQNADKAGITIYHINDVIAKGKERIAKGDWKPIEPTKEDCPMFSYTSGTTGDPKGVKLTHGALCGTSASVQLWMGADILGESDTYISYLPAAHSFEAALFAMSIIYGVRCGYFGGDVLKLVPEDLPALKPTFFPSVPRLYNKIFGKLKAGTEALTGIKGWLAKKAIAAKMANLHATGAVTHGCYDKIIFKKMKMMMGGNVRLMLTGSAPISGEVLNFLKICFCCPLTEGYGMTETSAGSVLVRIGDPKGGYVGGPVANVKIRIKDIPEMNYLCTNNPPKGEVCFKGPSVMKGYFKNQEKTDEMLSADGWLYSGDVGMIHPNGAIQIVDRAKNIFKLSQGEYIAPEKLENEFLKSEYIAQIWVHGDSLHDYVMMFIVLDQDRMKIYAKQNGIDCTANALCGSEPLRQLIWKDVYMIANQNKFNSLEKPKQMKLLYDPWTTESDILTPTMKLKRNIAKDRYADDVKKMYEEGPLKYEPSK